MFVFNLLFYIISPDFRVAKLICPTKRGRWARLYGVGTRSVHGCRLDCYKLQSHYLFIIRIMSHVSLPTPRRPPPPPSSRRRVMCVFWNFRKLTDKTELFIEPVWKGALGAKRVRYRRKMTWGLFIFRRPVMAGGFSCQEGSSWRESSVWSIKTTFYYNVSL